MSEHIEDKIEETADEKQTADKVSEEDIETAKEAEPEDIKEKGPFDLKNEVIEWLESFVFAMLVVQLVFIFLVRIVMVDGTSMNNTLFDGDRLIMSHVNYTPERGDIVVIDSDVLDKIIIKRVIGVGGDKVVVDYNTNHVYVNDEQIEDDTVKEVMIDGGTRGLYDLAYMTSNGVYAYKVPDDSVFVMGDNRNDSKDSRSIGFVSEDAVLGKAVFRVYPLDKIGPVS